MKNLHPFPEWIQEKDYFKTGGGGVGPLLLRNKGEGSLDCYEKLQGGEGVKNA